MKQMTVYIKTHENISDDTRAQLKLHPDMIIDLDYETLDQN